MFRAKAHMHPSTTRIVTVYAPAIRFTRLTARIVMSITESGRDTAAAISRDAAQESAVAVASPNPASEGRDSPASSRWQLR